ncbi:DUF805 domain-containing protein [Methylocystis bryophila]|uniref:DUF805 domain-containing protein n=1 Tax=Methylocystis bryophila TaxID=655015 RepID=A0A1W6MZV2_9HYPH|nr:DUF805 domain-containing protein [Methylocystis bryophila]ARN83093.1 hypothetical protein B1812_20675 [Methylocystis bryophila]BDV39410.1 membrane protein [Methylocystis bryophila]
MGYPEAVKTCLTAKYSAFMGRAPRSEYWWFALFTFFVYIFGGVPLLVIAANQQAAGLRPEDSSAFIVIALVLGLCFLALLLPTVCVTVRRLHDLDWSGWWYLTLLVPYLGSLAALVMLIGFCFRGTVGANRFGEDPLLPAAQTLAPEI